MNANNKDFKNSNRETVQYKLDDDGTITSLMINDNNIIEQYADQGLDLRIMLIDADAFIGVHDANDTMEDKNVLVSGISVPLKELTIQKFETLIENAMVKLAIKREEDENDQMAVNLNQKDFLLKDSQPLINRDTFAVRGDGKCFITAVLYQYCKNAGLDDADLQEMGFYSPYNLESAAAQQVKDYYDRFFKDNPPSEDNHREAPDVVKMKEFLEKELGIGIKVEYYGKSDDIIIRNSEYDEQPVNQNEIITVALLSHDRHVVLPQTIDNMKERGTLIEEVQEEEEKGYVDYFELIRSNNDVVQPQAVGSLFSDLASIFSSCCNVSQVNRYDVDLSGAQVGRRRSPLGEQPNRPLDRQ